MLPLLYFALPAGTWLVAFLYYRHVRFHPAYQQFKRQENTRSDVVRKHLNYDPF